MLSTKLFGMVVAIFLIPSGMFSISPTPLVRYAEAVGVNGDIDPAPGVALVLTIPVSTSWFATSVEPPAFFFGGLGSFSTNSYSYSSLGVTHVKVTDDFCKGDVFEVFDNDVSIGSTSLVASESPACSPEVGPDAAYADPTWSSGCFTRPAGNHVIKMQVIKSWGPGRGYIEVHDGPCPDRVPEFGLAAPLVTALAAAVIIPVQILLRRRKTE